MIKWTLSTRKIKSLIQYHKNPRYITVDGVEALYSSISKFGLIDKPIINLDNTIIGGHQRISVLTVNGYKTVECWIPDRLLDEKEVEELNIRLNKNTGAFDFDILANQWEVEDLLNWGFDENDLQINDPSIENLKEMALEEQDKDKTISCPKCGHEFVE